VDLASMARSSLDATAIEASSMGLHIEAELSPAVVGGDGALLDGMVANLVENAVRSSGRRYSAIVFDRKGSRKPAAWRFQASRGLALSVSIQLDTTIELWPLFGA
jgi:signal transduction histidine kinase